MNYRKNKEQIKNIFLLSHLLLKVPSIPNFAVDLVNNVFYGALIHVLSKEMDIDMKRKFNNQANLNCAKDQCICSMKA